MLMEIENLSEIYRVRKLNKEDVNKILTLEKSNPMYFEYCPPEPSAGNIINDLAVTPPGVEVQNKYYIGYFEEDSLIAVMDFIMSYPDDETVYIGLFMVDGNKSGLGIGSSIIEDFINIVKIYGYKKLRLGYIKGNEQSRHFWTKCGFADTGIECVTDLGTVVVLENSIQ